MGLDKTWNFGVRGVFFLLGPLNVHNLIVACFIGWLKLSLLTAVLGPANDTDTTQAVPLFICRQWSRFLLVD